MRDKDSEKKRERCRCSEERQTSSYVRERYTKKDIAERDKGMEEKRKRERR